MDGSASVAGSTTGENLEFIKGGPNTINGTYDVVLTQNATRAFWGSGDSIDEDMLSFGLEIKINEGGRVASYKAQEGDTVETFAAKLNSSAKKAGLDLIVGLEDDRLLIIHNQYGSAYGFQVFSNNPDIMSDSFFDDETLNFANPGLDVAGRIGGYNFVGNGQNIHGEVGTPVEGIQLRYSGNEGDLEGDDSERLVGQLNLSNKSMTFHVGEGSEDSLNFSIPGFNTNTLGRGVSNENDFKNIREIDLTISGGARDALRLLDQAQGEVSRLNSDIGSFQRHQLETKARNLRITRENIMAAESTIGDADFALEISNTLKNMLLSQNQYSLAAQGNRNLMKIEELLK